MFFCDFSPKLGILAIFPLLQAFTISLKTVFTFLSFKNLISLYAFFGPIERTLINSKTVFGIPLRTESKCFDRPILK